MRSPLTTESSPYSLQLEKACTQQWRPSAAKNKLKQLSVVGRQWQGTQGRLGTWLLQVSAPPLTPASQPQEPPELPVIYMGAQ